MEALVVDTVRSIDRGNAMLVRVRSGGGESWLFEAFEDEPPHFWAALNERSVLVVGRDGGIGSFNVEKRMTAMRQQLPMKLEHCLLSPDRRRLLAVSGDAVCVIDTNSLLPISVVNGLKIAQGSRIGLREDGRITVGYESKDDKRPGHGVHLIDPARGKAELQFLEAPTRGFLRRIFARLLERRAFRRPGKDMVELFAEPMIWISPDGRYGIRRSYGSMPLETEPGKYPRWRYRLTKNIIQYLTWGTIGRAGIMLEVWRIAPTGLVRLFPARMFGSVSLYDRLSHHAVMAIATATLHSASPATPAFRPPKTDEVRKKLEELRGGWADFLAQLVDVVWEPDCKHFWLLFSDGRIRRMNVAGYASPIIGFQNFDILEHKLAAALRAGALRHMADGRIALEVTGVGRVWLDRRDWKAVHGMPAPPDAPADTPFIIGQVVDHFESDKPAESGCESWAEPPVEIQQRHDEQFAKSTVTVPVGAPTPKNCLAAIASLTATIGERFPELARNSYLLPKFETDGRQLDEASFFELVRKECPDAFPAVRSLVETFSRHVAAMQPTAAERLWGDERGTSALAHAARALALMDSGSMPVFKAFMDATGQQYDEFLWDDVVPEIFESHRWPDRDMLRWGIVFVVRELALGMREEGRLLEKADMMEGAQQLVSPAGFVELLFSCVEDEDLLDDKEQRDRVLAEFILDYLEPIDDFRCDVRGLLNARFAEEMPGVIDQLAELSQPFNPDGDRGTVTIPVADLSEAGHIAAIETLTRAIVRDLPAMLRDYFFAPIFRTPDGFMNEADFFDSVRKNAPGAVPALRALMKDFTERAPGIKLQYVEQMYGGMDEATGALGHAMHALVLMDPDAMPVLKAFISVMDAEHEEYARAHVIPGFFKAHGWPDEDRIRFAVDLYLSDWYRGEREYGNLWQGLGMRDAVQEILGADAFADRVIAWIGEGWNDSETDYGIRNFVSGNLGKDDPFDDEVVRAFKARRPELGPLLEPWERRFAK